MLSEPIIKILGVRQRRSCVAYCVYKKILGSSYLSAITPLLLSLSSLPVFVFSGCLTLFLPYFCGACHFYSHLIRFYYLFAFVSAIMLVPL